jgi:FkbH-like protein
MYIFRNYTIELLFNKFNPVYSGYGDISISVDDIKSERVIFFYNLNPISIESMIIDEINEISTKINLLFNNINYSSKNVLIILPDTNFYSKLVLSSTVVRDAYNQLYFDVIKLCNKYNFIKFVEFNDFTKIIGQRNIIDWKYYYTSQVPVNPKFNQSFSSWFSSVLNNLNYNRKKCLVLDCDNTLWGGVIGEEGMKGIKIGNSYPGIVYQDFQKKIIELYEKGVIITLCSKNNYRDVEDVFLNHPGMVLKLDHISILKINWENKAKNIKEIANELNIGLDSFVFIDDNPSERDIVRFSLPEVVIPEFPQFDYQIVDFFSEVSKTYFSTYKLTQEDLNKTSQYIENSRRNSIKENFINLEDYIASLDIEICFHSINNTNISRLAQMTQKTNQFNLTTKRYTESELDKLSAQGALILCGYVKDKFGDSGITILSIFNINGSVAECDSYLLSCRVLGKGIEKVAFEFILNYLFNLGIKKVTSKYIESDKNVQTASFFDKLGFECHDNKGERIKNYTLELSSTIEINNSYKIHLL